MTKEDSRNPLRRTFNLWGFLPPHMLYGNAGFGFQHVLQQEEEERKRKLRDQAYHCEYSLDLELD